MNKIYTVKSFIKAATINTEVAFFVVLIFIFYMFDVNQTNSSFNDNKDKFPIFGQEEGRAMEGLK